MVSLIDLAKSSGGDDSAPLRELRIGGEPAIVMVFTADVEVALFHWEKDPRFNCYVICPGAGCPLCWLGNAPKDFALLPVLNCESGAVEVLRVSRQRGAGKLIDGLLPVLVRSDLADNVVVIRRDNPQSPYIVTVQPLALGASRHEDAIEQFKERVAAGLKLTSAFCAPTSAELLEAERIAKKIASRPGYKLPDSVPPGPLPGSGTSPRPIS